MQANRSATLGFMFTYSFLFDPLPYLIWTPFLPVLNNQGGFDRLLFNEGWLDFISGNVKNAFQLFQNG